MITHGSLSSGTFHLMMMMMLQCEVIWNEFLEAVRDKGTAGVETVDQLKVMLGIETAKPVEKEEEVRSAVRC